MVLDYGRKFSIELSNKLMNACYQLSVCLKYAYKRGNNSKLILNKYRIFLSQMNRSKKTGYA